MTDEPRSESLRVKALRGWYWAQTHPCCVAAPSGRCDEHWQQERQRFVTTADKVEAVKALLGHDGLTLAEIRSTADGWSKLRLQELEQALRRDPEIVESRERRTDAAGRQREQVVLRVR